MTFPKKIRLEAWGKPELTGYGEELALTFEVMPKPKREGAARGAWRGKVEVHLSRYFVRKIAEEIALMQTRDRERINREKARLRTEVACLIDSHNNTET